MATVPQEELLSSIARLYDDSAFSDLTIVTKKKSIHAHKAIVGPRSAYLAQQFEGLSTLNLLDDDPDSVERVFEFIYRLDYSSHEDEAVLTNGNGIHDLEEIASPSEEPLQFRDDVSAAETAESKPKDSVISDTLDEFLPRAPKKHKKKKRAKAQAPAADSEAVPPADADADVASEAPASDAATVMAPEGPDQPAAEDPSSEMPPANRVTTHSRVHNLSVKYGIASLQDFSLNRFEEKIYQLWDTAEFVDALKELYARDGAAGQNRILRSIITVVLSDHQELLDQEDVADIARGGELSWDLLTQMRKASAQKALSWNRSPTAWDDDGGI